MSHRFSLKCRTKTPRSVLPTWQSDVPTLNFLTLSQHLLSFRRLAKTGKLPSTVLNLEIISVWLAQSLKYCYSLGSQGVGVMKSNPNLVQVLFEMSLFLTQLPVQPRVSNLLGSAACFGSTFSHSFNLYNLFQSLALISFGYRYLPGHHLLHLPRAKDLVYLIGTLVFPTSLL